MDPRSGRIASEEVLARMTREERSKYSVPVEPSALTPLQTRQLRRTGEARAFKNSKCPCGSGKRFKSCHMARKS